MKIPKMVKLIWKPKNPQTAKRIPTGMRLRNSAKEDLEFLPEQDDDGDWVIEVPYQLAAYTLSRPAPKWLLLEPEELIFEARQGFGETRQMSVKAYKKPESKSKPKANKPTPTKKEVEPQL